MRRFSSRPGANVPDPLNFRQALSGHQSLSHLGELLRASEARMALVRPMLPGALARFVKPGPIDEEAWCLLVANAAVAAKLRQLQPRIEAQLAERGLVPARLRIRIIQPQ